MSIQPIRRSQQVDSQSAPQFGQMERVETATTRDLEQWASELNHAYSIANTICGTMFVPQHFRNKPEETAAAILYGYTLGMSPMVSVKTIYVVHGTPALYAQQMYAIALASGHEIERVYADNERVEFRARRRGTKDWQKVEWTIERARLAKYTSNSKYAENPIGMLTEKCKAEAAKLVAPDALAGMNSVEEIQLGDFESTIVEEEPAPVKTRKLTRKPAEKKSEAAELAARPAQEPEPEPVADESTGEIQDDGPAAVLETDWEAELAGASSSREALIALWNRAVAEGAPQEMVSRIVDAGSKFA